MFDCARLFSDTCVVACARLNRLQVLSDAVSILGAGKDWMLVSRDKALSEMVDIIRAIVREVVLRREVVLSEMSPRFRRLVSALGMSGVGKSRMLLEMARVLREECGAVLGDRPFEVVELVFTFNSSSSNEIHACEPDDVDALLGWRALRHYFLPRMSVVDFYEGYTNACAYSVLILNACMCVCVTGT